jgi:hypothetical protein
MSDQMINKTETTPALYFQADENAIMLSGICIPEDPRPFFRQLNNTIRETMKNLQSGAAFHIRLDYFNTLSAKYLYDFLKHLSDTNVQIVWEYESDDEDMLEAGNEFAAMLQTDFEFRSYDG